MFRDAPGTPPTQTVRHCLTSKGIPGLYTACLRSQVSVGVQRWDHLYKKIVSYLFFVRMSQERLPRRLSKSFLNLTKGVITIWQKRFFTTTMPASACWA